MVDVAVRQHDRFHAASVDRPHDRLVVVGGIEDHDFAIADDAYHAWKTAGAKQAGAKIEDEEKVEGAAKKKKRGPLTNRPPKPPPWRGGQLDAFEGDLKIKKHFTSLLEAFEHATRGA